MDTSRPKEVKKMRGKVVRGTYAMGTKSERMSIFLETDNGRYILRRKNGPVFRDQELDFYIGKVVACDGFIIDTTILADNIAQIS